MHIGIRKLLALLLVLGMSLSLCACEEKKEKKHRKDRDETTAAVETEETEETEETTEATEPDEETTQELSYNEVLEGQWLFSDGDVLIYFDGMDAFSLTDCRDLDDITVLIGTYFYDGEDVYLDPDEGDRLIGSIMEGDGSLQIYDDSYDGYFYYTPEDIPEPTEEETTQPGSCSDVLQGEWIYSDSEVVLTFYGTGDFSLTDCSEDEEGISIAEGTYSCDEDYIYLDTAEGIRITAVLQADHTMIFDKMFDGYFFRPGIMVPDSTEQEEPPCVLDGEWKHETRKITLYLAHGSYFEYTEMDNRETAVMIDGGYRYEDGTIIMETGSGTVLEAYVDEDGYLHLYGLEGKFYLAS